MGVEDRRMDYEKYLTKNILMTRLINRFLRTVVEFVDVSRARYILDAGCGQGFVSDFLLRSMSGISITGVDIDIESIRNSVLDHKKGELFEGDIYDLPFCDNSFDTVMCLEVLEHLNEPQRAIQEIARVSKRYCIFSVPNEPCFRSMYFLSGRYIKRFGSIPEHINNWTKSQFLEMLNSELSIQLVKTPLPWVIALCRKDEVFHNTTPLLTDKCF